MLRLGIVGAVFSVGWRDVDIQHDCVMVGCIPCLYSACWSAYSSIHFSRRSSVISLKLSWRSLNRTLGENPLNVDRRTVKPLTRGTTGNVLFLDEPGPHWCGTLEKLKSRGVVPKSLSLPLGLPEVLPEGFGIAWDPFVHPCGGSWRVDNSSWRRTISASSRIRLCQFV